MNLQTLLQIQPANAKETKALGGELSSALNAKEGATASEFENLLEVMNSGKLSTEEVNQVFNTIQEGDSKGLEKLLKEFNIDQNPKEISKALQENPKELLQALSKEGSEVKELSPELKNILQESKLTNNSSTPKEVKNPEVLETKVQNSEVKEIPVKAQVKADIKPELLAKEIPAKAQKVATPETLKNNDLVDFNQFMNKQSPTAQKRMAMHSYGNHQEKKLFDQKFEAKVDTTILPRPEETELKIVSNDEAQGELDGKFMQNSEKHSPQVLKTNTQNMTFDLNKLTSSDTQKVIDQVQNYIVQSRAGSEPKMEVSFNHQELGKVDLMVEKMGKDALNIRIQTHGNEGASFFQKHQGDLLQTLNNSGIQVANFKLESSQTNTNSNQGQFSQNNSEQGQQGQNFASDNQRRQDSERRSELWKILAEREAA